MRVPAILVRWALIAAQGRLCGPIRYEGTPAGQDAPSADYWHVERFWREPKHGRFRLLAMEVINGVPATSKRWKRPGETRADALTRLGWQDLADADEPPVAAMELVVREFRDWLDVNPPIGKQIPTVDESAANAARWHG